MNAFFTVYEFVKYFLQLSMGFYEDQNNELLNTDIGFKYERFLVFIDISYFSLSKAVSDALYVLILIKTMNF